MGNLITFSGLFHTKSSMSFTITYMVEKMRLHVALGGWFALGDPSANLGGHLEVVCINIWRCLHLFLNTI